MQAELDPALAFVVLLVAFPLAGLVLRRWPAVMLPVVGWPLYYIGLNHGWWGCCGTGEGWQAIAVGLAVVETAATALAIGIGRAIVPPVR